MVLRNNVLNMTDATKIKLSAFLYGISFLFPHIFSGFIICSLILIFLYQWDGIFWFGEGFLWGIIAFSLHTFSLFFSLFPLAEGKFSFVCAWFFLISYASLYVEIWFFSTSLFVKYSYSWPLGAFFIVMNATFFFIGMSDYFLWIFDYSEGYICLNPLILFAHTYLLQVILIHSNFFISTFLFCGMCMVFALIHIKKSFCIILIILLPLLIFCISLFKQPYLMKPPEWLSEIGIITVPFSPNAVVEVYELFGQTIRALRKFISLYPEVKIIIMPESTLPFCVNNYISLIYSIGEVLGERHLIIGSHRSDQSYIFNSCYHITKEGVQEFYDKNHRIFFMERLPTTADFFCFGRWFLSGSFPFEQGKEDKVFTFSQNISFQPIICSDLFFLKNLKKSLVPLVVLINDAWFVRTSLPHLLMRSAVIKSINFQRELLYVSHLKSFFIARSGQIFPLKTLRYAEV